MLSQRGCFQPVAAAGFDAVFQFFDLNARKLPLKLATCRPRVSNLSSRQLQRDVEHRH